MKIFLFFFFLSIQIFCQDSLTNNIYKYDFIIKDSPALLFTMKQTNQNYLSSLRILNKELDELVENKKMLSFLQIVLSLFTIPLTHEEGHRSILTAKNLGSISKPFINSYGAATVIGVRDIDLKILRDTDLPNYIRLHSAGLESDYMLTRRIETIMAFEEDVYKNIEWEYSYRKLAILQYYLMGLFKYKGESKEEIDELERDIVGHDIYGFARHIYRPNMEFHRYTDYNSLSEKERNLVKRFGWRSLLNLLNSNIIGKRNFYLSENIKGNFGIGFTMAPFGDFIDENIWLKIDEKYNIHFYCRQFQNESNWFYGYGLSLHDYNITNRFSTTIATHFWTQPKSFDFFTNKSFTGGAIDLTLNYNLFREKEKWLKGFGVKLGLLYKSKGFLPEEIMLDEHFGFSIGTVLEF
ncbi:MAG: hypothetical protein IPH62_19190 [Ignavibacteriae bacterium]|nr:hypothetical protein [Ignavibacteriota bacterium]